MADDPASSSSQEEGVPTAAVDDAAAAGTAPADTDADATAEETATVAAPAGGAEGQDDAKEEDSAEAPLMTNYTAADGNNNDGGLVPSKGSGARLKRQDSADADLHIEEDIHMPSYRDLIVRRGFRLDRGWSHRKRQLFVGLLLFIYWVLGMVVMCPREKWSYTVGNYWVMATLLGIGYGDYAPTHVDTKLFVSAYIFFGVVVTTVACGVSAQKDLVWEYETFLEDAQDAEERARKILEAEDKKQQQQGAKKKLLGGKKARRRSGRRSFAFKNPGPFAAAGADGEDPAAAARGCRGLLLRATHGWDWVGAILSFVATFVFLIVGMLGLMATEGGKQFDALNSFYFTAVTMTHVGYGDFAPKKPLALWWLFFFMIFAWAFFVVVMGKVGAYYVEKEHAWELNDWGTMMEERGEEHMKVSACAAARLCGFVALWLCGCVAACGRGDRCIK